MRKGGSKGISTVGDESQRFELLYTRLRTKKALTRTTDMLHVLLQLSGDGGSQVGNNTAAAASNILGSVFNTKVMNKVDYNAKKLAAKGGDVEMKDTSSIKQIVSTKQK